MRLRRWGRAGRSAVSATAVLTLGAACGLLEGTPAGPDADAMAEDPLLHVELDGAEPGEVDTRTGTEGGLAPALDNPVSRASRSWEVASGEPTEVLRAAVDAADELDVAFWQLRCTRDLVTYRGAKEVSLGDGESEVMYASVALHTGTPPPSVRINLESAEHRLRLDAPPERYTPPVDGDCPAELVTALGVARA